MDFLIFWVGLGINLAINIFLLRTNNSHLSIGTYDIDFRCQWRVVLPRPIILLTTIHPISNQTAATICLFCSTLIPIPWLWVFYIFIHFALRLFTIWNISGCSKTPRTYIYSRPNSSSTGCMGIYLSSSELCQFLSLINCIFNLFDLIRCFLPVSHFSFY